MAVDITVDDIRPFLPEITVEKGEAMIAGALARAKLVAPCLTDETFPYADAVRAILVRVIVRWNDAAGEVTQVIRGPFAERRAVSRELWWPSEVAELQSMCKATGDDESPTGSALPKGQFAESPLTDSLYRAAWDQPVLHRYWNVLTEKWEWY